MTIRINAFSLAACVMQQSLAQPILLCGIIIRNYFNVETQSEHRIDRPHDGTICHKFVTLLSYQLFIDLDVIFAFFHPQLCHRALFLDTKWTRSVQE